MTDIDRRTNSLRNSMLFAVPVLAAGWIGMWLNDLGGRGSHTEGPGMLLWLTTPLTLSLLLRAFAGDGWADLGIRPALKGNLRWYAVGVLVYPVSIGLILCMGALFGVVSADGFASRGVRRFLEILVLSLAFNFPKNILEEFAWRGYLTPRLRAMGIHDYVNHILVGVIWSLWHLPYWIGLLDAASMRRFTGLGMPVFIVMSLIGITVSAILHGELRLITGSIWPPVVLHTVANAVTLTVLMEKFITLRPRTEVIFTPAAGGILGTTCILLAGLALYRQRLNGS